MAAFEDLVCKYDQQVLRIALRFTGNKDEAQDIYQEVFLRVHRGLKSFRFDSEFSTWLYRICTNVCITTARQTRRRHYLPLDSTSENISYGESTTSRVPKELVIEPNPTQQFLGKELGEQINAALGKLSPQQRTVFVLRHYEGHKLREIASMLQCAEGTVKKHLFTATARMREQLKTFHSRD